LIVRQFDFPRSNLSALEFMASRIFLPVNTILVS
jgi:hypothetical protein